MIRQGRKLHCLFGLPSVEEAENRLRHRAGYAVQQRMMLLGACAETNFSIFEGILACTTVWLISNAEQVFGVVTQKTGCFVTAGTFGGGWQEHCARNQLAFLVGCAEHFHRLHLPVSSQIQAPLHLDDRPAGTLQFALCGERIIAPHERLQNHFTTSQSVKSITPCTICARKNIGCMFSGSE